MKISPCQFLNTYQSFQTLSHIKRQAMNNKSLSISRWLSNKIALTSKPVRNF